MSSTISTLGGASEELLLQVSSDLAAIVSDLDPVPWDSDWHDIFDSWRQTNGKNSPIILVFCANPLVAAKKVGGCTRIFQFGMSTTRPQPGIYIVGRTVLGNAWQVAATSADYQALCQQVETMDLGSETCVVLGNGTSAALYLPRGVLGADNSVGVMLPTSRIDSALDDSILSAELQYFADNALAAEDARGTLWKNNTKFWPIEHAEKTIQRYLLIALRSTFKRYKFLDETRVDEGHIDIFILPKSKDEPGRAVLELKVIRQFGSTGIAESPADALKKLQGGIEQALTYMEEANNKYLCAYDMRKERDAALLDQIQAESDAVGVLFRSYGVFSAAATVRKAKAKNMKSLAGA